MLKASRSIQTYIFLSVHIKVTAKVRELKRYTKGNQIERKEKHKRTEEKKSNEKITELQ